MELPPPVRVLHLVSNLFDELRVGRYSKAMSDSDHELSVDYEATTSEDESDGEVNQDQAVEPQNNIAEGAGLEEAVAGMDIEDEVLPPAHHNNAPVAPVVAPDVALAAPEVQEKEPWRILLDGAFAMPEGVQRDAAIAGALALQKAAEPKVDKTKRYSPKSVALPPKKFDGKTKGLTFTVWAESMKTFMDIKGQDKRTAVRTAMTFLEGQPLTHATVLVKQQEVWVWDDWVVAMQQGLFALDPTQASRAWIYKAKLQNPAKLDVFVEKYLTHHSVLDDNEAGMAEMDKVGHFKQALAGTMYDAPTDVDELTSGPFKSLNAIINKCRAIFQVHGGAEAWKGGQVAGDKGGDGRVPPRRFKARGPGGSRKEAGGEDAPDQVGNSGNGTGNASNSKGNKRPRGNNNRQPFDPTAPCYNCGQTGHWSSRCPEPRNKSKKTRQAALPPDEANEFLSSLLNPSPNQAKSSAGANDRGAGAKAGIGVFGELVLRTSVFEEIEDMVDHSFDLDGNVGRAEDAQVEDFCTAEELLVKDISGRHVIVFSPTSDVKDLVAHYKECKAKAADSSSLCIVLPFAHTVASDLEGFRLLKDYYPGAPVFERRMANGDVGVCKEAPQRVQVWYDCPEVDPRNKALRMQFAGQVAGVKARVLVDTGASGCFLSKDYVKTNKLSVAAGKQANVVLPDGTTAFIHGYVTLSVRLKDFQEQVSMAVIDLKIPFDVVLGDAWLRSRYALIDYRSGCLTIFKQNRKFRIQACLKDGKAIHTVKIPAAPAIPPSIPSMLDEAPMFLSAMQARRAIAKEGCASFLVSISLQDEDTTAATPGQLPRPPPSDLLRYGSPPLQLALI